MKLQISVLTLGLFLMSCSPATIGNNGLSVPEYSKERRSKVHGEIMACNMPETVEFLKDYKVLRDQARVN